MSEHGREIKILNMFAAALLLGIVIGFVDGAVDVISNNIVFDHPTDEQTLSYFQKTIYLIYSMTLSGIFYGVLGLIVGIVLSLYSALRQRRLDSSVVLLLSSWLLFSFIVLKTEILLFSSFIAGSLGYKIAFLGIAILVSFLAGVLIYKISYVENPPGSSERTDFIPLCIKLITVSLLFWAGVSLPAKMFGERNSVLVSFAILAAGIVLTLVAYQLAKRIFTDSRIGQWRNSSPFVKGSVALLAVFLIVLTCLGIYWEEKPENLSYDYKGSSSLTQKNRDKPNVVLILIDTLRADHLSSYGYGRQTSPNVDKLAKEGVLFQKAVAPASWTKPSTASLHTSLYPSMHGVVYGKNLLPSSVTTLAERMKGAGYRTAGFVANPQIKAVFNFDQGFDFYDDTIVEDRVYQDVLRSYDLEKRIVQRLFDLRLSWTDNNNAGMLNKKFIPWLRENEDAPFFLYLHYIDPHEPYSPPNPFDATYTAPEMSENEMNMALYDGEIVYTDGRIGELLQTLEELNIADETLIVLTSDHGEEFLDHGGTGHGQSLYEEQIRVPIVMRYPPALPAGRVINEPRVEIIDIMPTVLDILDISLDEPVEGTSLLPLIRGENIAGSEDYVFNESYLSRFEGKAVTHGGWKYIFTESSELRDVSRLGPEELYDLETDPNELNNLIGDKSKIAKGLRGELSSFTQYAKEKAVSPPTSAEVDERTKEQLKSLGYVD